MKRKPPRQRNLSVPVKAAATAFRLVAATFLREPQQSRPTLVQVTGPAPTDPTTG
jgi:hypothetical protein